MKVAFYFVVRLIGIKHLHHITDMHLKKFIEAQQNVVKLLQSVPKPFKISQLFLKIKNKMNFRDKVLVLLWDGGQLFSPNPRSGVGF
jgi:hypothetical protein